MRGLKLISVRGIPIVLHWTFILFMAWIAVEAAASEGQSVSGALLIYASLFTCVALHELAHSLVAQRYGIRVRQILLIPFGGIAFMDRMPEEPGEEIRMAVAGPVFNLVVATLVFAFIYFLPGIEFIVDPFNPFTWEDVHANPTAFTQFTVMLFKLNMMLGVFNLLPAFPMDGGRILRALLVARGRTRVQATNAAWKVSIVLFVLMGLGGLAMESFWLPIIAFALYFMGQMEVRSVRGLSPLQQLRAAHLLPQEPLAVEPETTLGELVPHLLEGVPRHYPVITRGRVVGVLGHPDLVAALAREGGASLPVSAVMRPPVVAGADEPLDVVARRLAERGAPVALILDGGRLVGLASVEMLATLSRQLDTAGG